MKRSALGIVYRKELTDLLRDRRTLFSMIVVPVLVMPLLMAGLGVAGAKIARQSMREIFPVALLGEAGSPQTAAALHALDNLRFVPAEKADLPRLIADKKIRAAVELSPGFDAALARGDPASVQIDNYAGEIKSQSATGTLRDFFRRLRETTVKERLTGRNLPQQLINPFDVREENVAPPEKVSGNLVGMIVPYLVMMMCLMGSIYPAIDLTAGEKERGTMETLLCSPVARTSLVLGKCLMVLTVSLSTVVLSLTSTGLSMLLVRTLTADLGAGNSLPLTINPVSLLVVFVVLLPVALFISSAMLSIGLLARSVKEANSYLQPLMVVMIIPAVAAVIPGIELNGRLALVPFVSVSLVSKEILSGTYHWQYIAIIFASTCVYAAVALRVAVALFKRESVLFRT